MLAVDADSNQVSVLRVHRDSKLSLVPGGVVPSGGTLPDSIAVHGSLVYVANSGNGGSNYTGFRFFGGHLFRKAEDLRPRAPRRRGKDVAIL